MLDYRCRKNNEKGGDNMNVIDLRQKYMAIASFIYVYDLTAIKKT